MLANFLIGLREGLEASLIVSILIAYLVKTNRRSDIRYIWIGVGTAVVSVIVAFALVTISVEQLPFTAQEVVGGVLSIFAAGLVTWMIFWMRKTARFLKSELEGELSQAIDLGPVAIAVVAFVTVGREGLETAAFIWATLSGIGYTVDPFVGAIFGFAVSIFLGFLIYRGALRVNLAKFFTVTGALLIVVAAGVLAYGIYDLQEAGVLPGLNAVAFDISATIRPDGWLGTLLKGTVNFQPNPSILQVVAWVAYLVPVLGLYLFGPVPSPRRSAAVTVGE